MIATSNMTLRFIVRGTKGSEVRKDMSVPYGSVTCRETGLLHSNFVHKKDRHDQRSSEETYVGTLSLLTPSRPPFAVSGHCIIMVCTSGRRVCAQATPEKVVPKSTAMRSFRSDSLSSTVISERSDVAFSRFFSMFNMQAGYCDDAERTMSQEVIRLLTSTRLLSVFRGLKAYYRLP